MAKDNNGWDEYKRLILNSLESLQKEVACLKEQHHAFKSSYDKNLAQVKIYLSLGVAVGTGVLQVALFYIQQYMIH